MAFDVDNFEEEVISRSRTVPVLVDFWAPWCGPCRVLGPVLEHLASESNGNWKLAKINTDSHPEISLRYGIRGIPAVKLFVDGEVVDEFTGALPEYAVRQWLEKALPSETRKRVERAEREMASGNEGEARKLLEEALVDDPDNPKARILLAQLLVFEQPVEAAELVSGGVFAGPAYLQVEEAVRTVARLFAASAETLPEGEVQKTYLDAISALKQRDFDRGLEGFIDVIRKDRYYDDDGARKACVAIFTLLGEAHPAVRQHRRTFDMVLY